MLTASGIGTHGLTRFLGLHGIEMLVDDAVFDLQLRTSQSRSLIFSEAMLVMLELQLHAGASVGIDFAAQLNYFELRFCPFHNVSP